MGGKALKHHSVERVSTRELVNVFNRLNRIANMHDSHLVCVPWIEGKDDHGDIDVLTWTPHRQILRVLEAMHINTSRSVKNGDVFSVAVPIDPKNPAQCVQVDFIEVEQRNLGFSLVYFSGGDFGALIGRLAYHLGYTFAMDGFRIRADPDNHIDTDVKLSMPLDLAMAQLGYASLPDETTFLTYQNLWAYVMSSKFAHPGMFSSEATNADNRSRDKQRAAVGLFQAWIKETYPGFEPGAYTNKPASGMANVAKLPPQYQGQFEDEMKRRMIQKQHSHFINRNYGRGAVEAVFGDMPEEQIGLIIQGMQPLLPPRCSRGEIYDTARDVAYEIGKAAAKLSGMALGHVPKDQNQQNSKKEDE